MLSAPLGYKITHPQSGAPFFELWEVKNAQKPFQHLIQKLFCSTSTIWCPFGAFHPQSGAPFIHNLVPFWWIFIHNLVPLSSTIWCPFEDLRIAQSLIATVFWRLAWSSLKLLFKLFKLIINIACAMSLLWSDDDFKKIKERNQDTYPRDWMLLRNPPVGLKSVFRYWQVSEYPTII